MISYLEKYTQLPDDVKQGVSTPEVVQAIEELENKYDVTLATVVMRVMVKDISLVDLPKFFAFEYDMDPREAEKLVDEMQERVFNNVGAHLGISIDPMIKEKNIETSPDPSPKAEETEKSKPIRSSNFFFSPEDEEEVKELAQKLKIEEVETEAEKQETEAQLSLKVDKIVDKANLNFSSEELHQRFRKIIFTYVKGVRNRIDTKQTMLKDVKVGGLGLNDMLISKALKIADEIKDADVIEAKESQVKEAEKIDKEEVKPLEPLINFGKKADNADKDKEKSQNSAIPEASPVAERDAPYDFKALQKKNETSGKETIKKFNFQEINRLQTKTNETPVSKVGEEKDTEKPPLKSDAKDILSIDLSAKKDKAPTAQRPNTPIAVKRPLTISRSRIEDVKKMPKLSGPVDELRDLNLINFRRLNQDPAKALASIKEKLQFLEDDSYEKRLQGIKAWRQSAVNRLYLSIGQESIARKIGVEDIIEEQRKNNQETLSYGEFLAIMDFNRSIRF
jgi:hypothetical protein